MLESHIHSRVVSEYHGGPRVDRIQCVHACVWIFKHVCVCGNMDTCLCVCICVVCVYVVCAAYVTLVKGLVGLVSILM